MSDFLLDEEEENDETEQTETGDGWGSGLEDKDLI